MTYSERQKIPKSVANQEEGNIPNQVAISPNLEDYANEKIFFSFEKYNSRKCEIAKMQQQEVKKLTKTLNKVSSTFHKHIFNKAKSRVVCKAVKDSGNYSGLFNNSQEDREIYEIYTPNDGTANRILGFFVGNIFYIITIWKKHR